MFFFMDLSLRDIVEGSFDDYRDWIDRVRGHGHSFDYELSVADKFYSFDFTSRDRICIGTCVINEFILNAIKSLLGVHDFSDIINRRYSPVVFERKVPFIKGTLDVVKDGYFIAVDDNGPGISSENIKRIWERNFSTFGTNGLGLAGAQEVVRGNYGGKIEVSSEMDKLTRFSVYLPSRAKKLFNQV